MYRQGDTICGVHNMMCSNDAYKLAPIKQSRVDRLCESWIP